MMNQKYELVEGKKLFLGLVKLYRVRALKDFGNVKKGELGGFVESEKNLSQEGSSWIYDNGVVVSGAKVSEDATVYDRAIIAGRARVSGKASVNNYAFVRANAVLNQKALVGGHSEIFNPISTFITNPFMVMQDIKARLINRRLRKKPL